MVSVVIFSTGLKDSKFECWTSENANYKQRDSYINFQSCLCVYASVFLILYQVTTEPVYCILNTFYRFYNVKRATQTVVRKQMTAGTRSVRK